MTAADLTPAALPGQPVPARRDRRATAATNFAVASGVADGDASCACSTSDGARDPVALAGVRRRRLARVRAGRRAGPGLRLPRDRAVRSGPRAALQPGQAAARPVRPGHRRRGPVRPGGPRPRRRRPRPAQRARLGRPRAAQPGRRPGLRLERRRRPAPRATPTRSIYEVHVKGFTATHPDVPAGAARHVRRAGPRRRRSPTSSTSA